MPKIAAFTLYTGEITQAVCLYKKKPLFLAQILYVVPLDLGISCLI
jgi:hypothetical protein